MVNPFPNVSPAQFAASMLKPGFNPMAGNPNTLTPDVPDWARAPRQAAQQPPLNPTDPNYWTMAPKKYGAMDGSPNNWRQPPTQERISEIMAEVMQAGQSPQRRATEQGTADVNDLVSNALANRRPVANQLSGDPRYSMKTPPKPQGPGLNQGLFDAASEAAPGASQNVSDMRMIYSPDDSLEEQLAKAPVNAALRAKRLQRQLDEDPFWQDWKEKARAAGANQMESGEAFPFGVQVPTLKGPAGISSRSDVIDANNAARDRIRAREDRQQDFYDRRAQGMALSRAASSPQAFAASMMGQMASGGANGNQDGLPQLLMMMGHPQAAQQLMEQQFRNRQLSVQEMEAQARLGDRRDAQNATRFEAFLGVRAGIQADQPNLTPAELDAAAEAEVTKRLGPPPQGSPGGQFPSVPSSPPSAGIQPGAGQQPQPEVMPGGVPKVVYDARGKSWDDLYYKYFAHGSYEGTKRVRDIMALPREQMLAEVAKLPGTDEEKAKLFFDPDTVTGAWDTHAFHAGRHENSDFYRQHKERITHAFNYMMARAGLPPARNYEEAAEAVKNKTFADQIPDELKNYHHDLWWAYQTTLRDASKDRIL